MRLERPGLREIAFLLIVLPRPATSALAAERLRFQHVTVDDGLSSNWVRAIVKDSHGFMWFGTARGLDRYDGARLATYRHVPNDPHSLPATAVTALFEDRSQRLWVGVRGSAAVALYDRDEDRFRSIAIDTSPLSTRGFDVARIIQDKTGRVWLAAQNGLHLAEADAAAIRLFWRPSEAGATSDAVRHLVEGPSGELWVGGSAGLHRLDPRTRVATRWSARIDGRDIPAPFGITALHIDPAGFLWFVGPGTGLVRLDTSTLEAKRYGWQDVGGTGLGVERPRRLAADAAGRLYIGSEDGGLSILDPRTETFSRYEPDPTDPDAIGAASIWATYLDDQGILWLGTFNAGVDYATPFGHRFALLRSGPGRLSNPHVTSVLEDGTGDLWIGTDGGGLNRLDRDTGRFTYYRHAPQAPDGLASDAVLALHEDVDGGIWVGTWAGGLQRLDPRRGRFRSYPDARVENVWAIADGPGERLYVATLREGVQVLDRRSGRFTPLADEVPGASFGPIHAIVADSGKLWVAHSAGVDSIDVEGSAVTSYLPGVGVTAVLFDRHGRTWFGTGGKGLYCFDEGRVLRGYTTADGLPSDNVVALQEDGDGHLWIATTRGLARFEHGTEHPSPPRFVTFGAHDGLPGGEFRRGASYKMRSGELLFGGQRGLGRFSPDDVRLNVRPPPVAVTGVRVSGRLVPPGDRQPLLSLSPDEAAVTFEFAALDYVMPPKNRYRYKLEGFDPDWSPASSEPTATYTSLPPGTYTLRVQAAGSDGAWNETGASLPLRRRPRLQERPAFWMVVALGVAAAVLGIHRLKVLSHLRTERELSTRVADAMAQVKKLSGLVPVCAWCKKARDDQGYWSELEAYLRERSEAEFSDSRCPDCSIRGAAAASSEGRTT